MRKRVFLLTIVLLLVATFVSAQNLMDDPEYSELINEVERLQDEAQAAIDDGRYEEATALARQAEEAAEAAEARAQEVVLRFRANSWVNNIAPERIEVARSYNAPERYPDDWERANELMEEARGLYEDEEWFPAIQSARNVVRALEDVRRPGMTAQDEDQASGREGLPATYIVRLLSGQRDSFWKIAGYDFVYGDPWKWRELYEANRQKLPEPDNPDLILPGMEMSIPELEGESRSGVWNPQDRVED
jgi:nucleoid-associated protein YgaU